MMEGQQLLFQTAVEAAPSSAAQKKMDVVPRSGKWWITNVPETEDCGPYDTRKEAESDRIGMERFFRHAGRRGFMTCDSAKET